MSATALKVATHAVPFLVALVALYLGLGVGYRSVGSGARSCGVIAIAIALLNVLVARCFPTIDDTCKRNRVRYRLR